MIRLYISIIYTLVIFNSSASAFDEGPLSKRTSVIRSLRFETENLMITSMPLLAPCLSTDGKFATDGTQSWEPSCFGTFTAAGQLVKVYPTRGTHRGSNGQPNSKMFTSNLIQAQGNGEEAKETNGQLINMDIVGGAASAAQLNTTNATGQLISLRQRPGPYGDRPPTAWGHNVDIHIAPGAGNVQSYGAEYDINNFNKDCAPGSGCLSSALFLNGISGYANTSWIYLGGGSTQSRIALGSIKNGRIRRESGEAFTSSVHLLTIAGKSYHVKYINADEVQADEPIPDFENRSSYEWSNAMTHFGILFQGPNNISDTDLALNTSAYTALRVAGNHRVALDTTEDVTAFSLITKAGQRACFNGFSACIGYDSGYFRYEENGGKVVEFVSEPNSLNGLRVTSGPISKGPTLEPTPSSIDNNVPLDFRAKGSASVRVLSNLSISAGLIVHDAPGVSCSGLPTQNFQVNNGIITRC